VQPLPEWLVPLLDADAMRALDSWAIEQRGVPGIDLMERAGAAVAREVERLDADGEVTVVCGKGNNGGDGLVAARLLRDAGRRVTVVCVAPPEDFSGDAATNLQRLPGSPPVRLDGSPWGRAGAGRGEDGEAGGEIVARKYETTDPDQMVEAVRSALEMADLFAQLRTSVAAAAQ